MRDRDLYRQILGIEPPWSVEDVELSTENREVLVHLANAERLLPCPECGKPCRRHDARSRRWRHLDTCQFATILTAEVPRISCQEHGVLQVRVPWAEPGSGFTALFEALVIDWLREASLLAVAELCSLSWKAVDGIQRRAVARGLARRTVRLPQHLGVDETSFQKRHEYVTVVLDQDEDTVAHVAQGRKRAALDEFFAAFSEPERRAVETVAMDMCEAYIRSVEDHIPGAQEKIAFDRFHVAQHLSRAVDQVRRAEHRVLLEDGDSRLKGTRYLWLRGPATLSEAAREALEELRKSCLRTARAWAIKELAAGLWNYRTRGWAQRAWTRWYSWAIRSRLEPIKRVARMIKRYLPGILNAVVSGITNARSEAINARIQAIKRTACGFRNPERFRAAILFHLGGLDLYPAGVIR
jgi:transposase